ncbi:hypothetical protein CQA54_06980 [Helicobacter equorum]|uniref:Uncharacterized protein n=1 Tax=Helicobacter equorum TaxID=361872 RepID=A0A3D8ING0_9HELI|nr:hypothetical protein CQA54_06980 [Helicobacter equorum]
MCLWKKINMIMVGIVCTGILIALKLTNTEHENQSTSFMLSEQEIHDCTQEFIADNLTRRR